MDKEDQERLVRIEVGLESLGKRIDESVIARLENHGKRIKDLEVFRWMAGGGGIAIAGAVAWLKLKLKLTAGQ